MRLSKKPVEKPFVKQFGDEEASITIRQATVGDNIKRNELMSEASLVVNDNFLGQEIKQSINPLEVQRYEAMLTLSASNFTDDDGASWFSFNANGKVVDQAAFERAYNALPDARIADWIHECVIEVNPQWSRQDEDEGE